MDLSTSVVPSDPFTLLILHEPESRLDLVTALLNEIAPVTLSAYAVDGQHDLEQVLRTGDPALILCEHGMAALSSAQVLEVVQSVLPDAPVLFIATDARLQDIVGLMRQGARGFVDPFNREQFLDLIRQEMKSRSSSRQKTVLDTGEHEFRMKTAYLNELLETMQDAILSTTFPDLQVIYVSSSFERIFGYPLQRFVEDRNFFRTIIHPDDLERAMQAMQDCMLHGFAELEHRIVLPDGAVRWLQRRVWVNYDDTGRPVRVDDVARDVTERKSAEAAIVESEETYRLVLSAISDAVFVTDSVGDFTFICPNVSTLFGHTRSEVQAFGNIRSLLGENLFDPAELEQLGEIPNIERTVVDKQGNPHEVLITVKRIAVKRGTTLYSCRDVTERNRIARTLTQSEERLRSILENLQDMVWSSSTSDYRISYLNPVAETIYGRPVEAFLTEPNLWLEVVHPEDRSLVMEYGDLLLQQGFRDVEYRIVRPGGEVRWLHDRAWVVKDASGKVIRLEGIASDVTERRKAEEAVRASEERYRSLIESADAAIMVLDRDCRYIYLNEIAAAPFGVPASALLGKTVYDLFPPPQAESIFADVQKIISTATGMLMETEVTLAGEQRWFRTSIQPVRDAAGVVFAAMIFSTDITAKKRVEIEIRKQNQILQQSHELIALANFEGRLTYMNRGGAAMLGATEPQAFLNQSIASFHTEADARYVLEEALPAAIRTGYWRGENRLKTVDGRLVDVDQMIFPIRDDQGSISEMAAIMSDISERKKAETALRQNESYLRSLVDSQTAFNIRVDMNGNLSYCNKRYLDEFGWYAPDLIGIHSLEMILPSDHEKVLKAVQDCIQNVDVPVQVELRKPRRDGGQLWTLWEFSAVQGLDGAIKEIHCVGFDISKQKAAEAELQALNATLEQRVRERAAELELINHRIEAVFNHSGDGILLLDLYQGIQQANHAFESLLNLTPQDYLGKPLSAFFDPADASQIERAVQQAAQTHQKQHVDSSIQQSQNQIVDVELSIAPVNRSENAVLNLVCIIHDITERKKSQESLLAALEKEKELGELKSRFVSMASHEFRTPLAAILATTETLTIYRDKMDAAQIDARLDRVRQQVMHMKDIMEDVLQLARIQARRVRYEPTQANLDTVCREIVAEFNGQPEYRDRITYSGFPGALLSFFDTRLIRQAIGNLISNAVKYSASDKRIEVSLLQTGQDWILKVRDQGIGIPSSDLKHLFEPFHRAENVGTISGTGLGLSIARESIELHGGTIMVESQVGQGTTMTVIIPVLTERPGDASEES